MPKQRDDYLSVAEQSLIADKIRFIIFSSPQETVIMRNGPWFAGGVLLLSGFSIWRCAFRGYNLARYDRRRLVTVAMPVISAPQAAMYHNWFVTEKLFDMFRDESYWTFGLRSALANQPGFFMSFAFITTFTFWHAHEIGVIPTKKNVFAKGALMYSFNIYLNNLKPYIKPLAKTWAFSTAFMFIVGLVEYRQSLTILAKVDRKTTGRRDG